MKMDSPPLTPNLDSRFLQPPGWRWHHFTNPHGRKLRFGTVAPKSKIPDAVVVCLPGLSEFSEKYYELANNLLDRNLSLWILDWQGQGRSDRPLSNPQKRHVESFDSDIEDLHYFLMEYVKHASVHPDVGRIPMVMLGHSMGGNIGLRYLMEHPETFACAAFSAPLTAIKAADFLPLSIAADITAVLKEFMNLRYIVNAKDWSPAERADPKRNIFTHDPTRGAVHNAWMQADPVLQVGGVTYGWLHAALKSCYILENEVKTTPIQIPCLFALAEKDSLVSNTQTRKIISSIPNAETLELKGSFHEIMMEEDSIRNTFLDRFIDFLGRHNVREKLKRF